MKWSTSKVCLNSMSSGSPRSPMFVVMTPPKETHGTPNIMRFIICQICLDKPIRLLLPFQSSVEISFKQISISHILAGEITSNPSSADLHPGELNANRIDIDIKVNFHKWKCSHQFTNLKWTALNARNGD